MSLRQSFIKHVGPGGLAGCTLREWLTILQQNRFAVDVRYWPRAAFTTFNCAINSYWSFREQRYEQSIARTEVLPPLIVLGIWRSGTTHLHNLLSQDVRFAWPNTYQSLYPNTFLSTESLNAATLQTFMSDTRPMDNVKQGVREPQEDEFALVPSGLSFIVEFAFPRTGAPYRRFLTLRNATPDEVDLWKSKLMWFLRKLTYKYQLPLVLKSPGHTCRIKLLLELFPDAKFVHIHRNPYEVFQSTLHTATTTLPFWRFQTRLEDSARLMDDYAEVYDTFFEQRDLIPRGNYCDVGYEQLKRNPKAELQRIYESLRLPDFADAEPRLDEYLKSIAAYKTNEFRELPPAMRNSLSQRLARCFDEWGYDKNGMSSTTG